VRAPEEKLRWTLAAAGPLFFLASSFMPLLGGAAKQRARCIGREFTDEFDVCFNDYLPIAELVVPLLALALLYMFARFAFALFAPAPKQRKMGWRLASSIAAEDHWPILHGVAAAGVIWALWRRTTYLFAAGLWRYVLFWLAVACWFAAGLVIAWPRRSAPSG